MLHTQGFFDLCGRYQDGSYDAFQRSARRLMKIANENSTSPELSWHSPVRQEYVGTYKKNRKEEDEYNMMMFLYRSSTSQVRSGILGESDVALVVDRRHH